ncbi:MAG TPA: 3-dehydroquinate synthase [Blastocatellia bacterium]|nr:3-dehydroquinate synthase [Blastocatellia bacterium]
MPKGVVEHETITVNLGDRSYPIHIGAGLLNETGTLTRAAVGEKARQAVIVSNPAVDAPYGKRVAQSLKRAGFHVRTFLIGDGERYKTLRTAESLYTFLIENHIERSGIIVALGGGVVGDLAGFVAATYLRGVRFIQIPTTLLAQIDSSVGGKTGVNHRLGKNLIGAFHQPSVVVIDPETLRTLPPRQTQSGLYEAIKYGVIRDRSLFERISGRIERLKRLDQDELTYLIARSCRIKADVVEQDEREGGLRRILNFGHTVGHALEALTHYRRFYHGEAVGHGMRVAARIAERMGLLAANDANTIDAAVRGVGRLPGIKSLAPGDIISVMNHDKKAEAGRVAFVLPVEIGRVVVRSDVPLQAVRSALKDALS